MGSALERLRAADTKAADKKTAAFVHSQQRKRAQYTASTTTGIRGGESTSQRVNRVLAQNFGNTGAAADTPKAKTAPMQRVGGTLSGAAKSYGASVVNTLGTTYATQKDSFTKDMERQTADSYSRQNQRFRQEYQQMLAENEKNPGTWSQLILDNQRRKVEQTDTLSQNLSGLAQNNYRPKAAQQVYGLADQIQADANKDIQRAKEGLGAVGQFAVDVGVGAAQLAGDMAVGAATGGSAAIPVAVRSFGGKSQEARQEGASLDKQVATGLTSALTGLVTEKISSVGNIQTKAFGSGALDDIMEGVVAAVEKTGKTKAGRAALNRLASAGVGAFGEGLEEGLESVIDQTVTSRIYSDKPIDWKQVAEEAVYSGLVGGAIGSITGGLGGTNTSSWNSTAETQLESTGRPFVGKDTESAQGRPNDMPNLPTARNMENLADDRGTKPSVDKVIPTAYNETTSGQNTSEQSVARPTGQTEPTVWTVPRTSENNKKNPKTTVQRGSADNSVTYETFAQGYRQRVNPRAMEETIRKSYEGFQKETQTIRIGDRTVTRPQFRQVIRGLTDDQLNEFFDFVRGEGQKDVPKKISVQPTVVTENLESPLFTRDEAKGNSTVGIGEEAAGTPPQNERELRQSEAVKVIEDRKSIEKFANSMYDIGSTEKNVDAWLRDKPLREMINSGAVPLGILEGQQKKHIQGTQEFNQYVAKLAKNKQHGPSRLTITQAEAQKLIDQYHGTGILERRNDGEWKKTEIITSHPDVVGVVVNNITGAEVETTVFKIHYGKNGTHIVPDYPSKKGAKAKQ